MAEAAGAEGATMVLPDEIVFAVALAGAGLGGAAVQSARSGAWVLALTGLAEYPEGNVNQSGT